MVVELGVLVERAGGVAGEELGYGLYCGVYLGEGWTTGADVVAATLLSGR